MRIMVVEDDALIALDIVGLLEDLGHEVVAEAADANEAWALAEDGRPDIAVYFQPVTEAGRIEMLPFVREQAVSITAHRFGNPYKFSEGVI